MLLLCYALLLLLLCTCCGHAFVIILLTAPQREALQLQPHREHPRLHPELVLRATITNSETWEWDGTVKEGAHDDELESVDNVGEEECTPSIGFMSAVATFTGSGNVVGVGSSGIAGATQASALIFDPLLNSGMIHRPSLMNDMSEDDLLEMGGDPDFLGDDGDGVDDIIGNHMSALKDLNDSHFFEWDGMVDEDAHLDM